MEHGVFLKLFDVYEVSLEFLKIDEFLVLGDSKKILDP